MKLPALRLDKDAFAEFLLRHGEKIGGGVVAVGAALLIWGGIDSLRSRSVRPTELPQAIRAEVERADSHIASMPRPPDDLLPRRPSLTDDVTPWLGAKPQAAPALAVLDKPLFPEFSRRSQPEVLPVEDLRASAGIAVLPVQAAGAAPGRPLALPPADRRGRTGRDRRSAFPGPGELEGAGFPGAGDGFPQAGAGTPGRIVPYVIVTGLIPVAKQQEEYRRRFASAGYRDARRDSPLWSDFTIERCSVVNGTDGPWRPIELAGAVAIQARDWPATQPLPLPSEYFLQATEERRSPETPLDFAGLLPQRIDQPWAGEPLHPWVLEHLRSRIQRAESDTGEQPGEPQQPDAEPVFGEPGFGDREPRERGAQPPGDRDKASAAEPAPDYRVFSFIDTTVTPEGRYRYRVRLKVWNPNINLPPQHLVDPELAKEKRLSSAASAATRPVLIPDPTRLLVDVVPAAEVKKLRLKPGMLEVLVLAAGDTGNYALRSVLIDVGGLANVEKRLNRPGELRARGEDAITDRLLVDVVGQQVEGDDKPRRGPRPVPEPFTAIFLRPDGTFEQVTAADSERLIDRYRDTLPERESGRRDSRPGGENQESDIFPGAPGPSNSPFSFPR